MDNLKYALKSHVARRFAFILGGIVVLSGFITILVYAFSDSATPLQKAEKLLADVLLFDGHNDFAINVRMTVQNDLRKFNFSQNLSTAEVWSKNKFSHTDLIRLRAGGVKAQFWVARAECDSQFKDAVEIILEQIDLIKRLVASYSSEMALATSYDELIGAVQENKIASLITICCGHSIQWSFAILRVLYELGVRAMTLVPAMCSIPWVDSAAVDRPNNSPRIRPWSDGLSPFGEEVIFEMNRLGMIVDISEASIAAMKEVLILSAAPVIFSHSAARALCDTEKNIPDDVLKLVEQNNALIMVTFYPEVLRCDGGNVTIANVVEHIEYLRSRTTVANVGIGSDFDAVDVVTEGLEDTSKFPNLFAALLETDRWSNDDLEKLAGQNMLRILQEVESVRDKMRDVNPRQSWIKMADLKRMGFDGSCSSSPAIEPVVPQFDLSKFGISKPNMHVLKHGFYTMQPATNMHDLKHGVDTMQPATNMPVFKHGIDTIQ